MEGGGSGAKGACRSWNSEKSEGRGKKKGGENQDEKKSKATCPPACTPIKNFFLSCFIVVQHFYFLHLPSRPIRLANDVALEEQRGQQRRQQQASSSDRSGRGGIAAINAAAVDLLLRRFFSFSSSSFLDPFRPPLCRLAGRHGARLPGGPHPTEAAAARGVGGEHGPLRGGRRGLLRVEGGGGRGGDDGGSDGGSDGSSSSSWQHRQSSRRRRRSGHRRGEDAQARADRERSDPVRRGFVGERQKEEEEFFPVFAFSFFSRLFSLKTKNKQKTQNPTTSGAGRFGSLAALFWALQLGSGVARGEPALVADSALAAAATGAVFGLGAVPRGSAPSARLRSSLLGAALGAGVAVPAAAAQKVLLGLLPEEKNGKNKSGGEESGGATNWERTEAAASPFSSSNSSSSAPPSSSSSSSSSAEAILAVAEHLESSLTTRKSK